jgi:hypothetical protein
MRDLSQPCERPRAAELASLLVPLALLLAVPSVRADDEPPAETIFRSNTDEVLRGAATLAGAGCQGGHGSAMVLGLLMRGDQLRLWKLEGGDRAPELRAALLRRVKDSTGLMIDNNAIETEAYCEALYKASLVSLGAFANSARRDLTVAHLLNEPKEHRGQVIHFEGEVRRIRRMSPPAMLVAEGFSDLYECWVFDTKRYGANPVCLVCSELPAGVEPGEQLSLGASFDAYFFKRYRYVSGDSKPGQARLAPLFLGRSFVLTRPIVAAGTEEDGFALGTKTILVLFLGVVLAAFVLIFAGHWWYQRADRRVQARVRAARDRDFADPGTPGLPGTTPSAN